MRSAAPICTKTPVLRTHPIRRWAMFQWSERSERKRHPCVIGRRLGGVHRTTPEVWRSRPGQVDGWRWICARYSILSGLRLFCGAGCDVKAGNSRKTPRDPDPAATIACWRLPQQRPMVSLDSPVWVHRNWWTCPGPFTNGKAGSSWTCNIPRSLSVQLTSKDSPFRLRRRSPCRGRRWESWNTG